VRSNQLSVRPKLESLEVFNKDRCRPHPALYLEPGDTLLATERQTQTLEQSPQNEERALYRVSVFRQGFVISSFIKQVEKFFAALEQNVFTEKS